MSALLYSTSRSARIRFKSDMASRLLAIGRMSPWGARHQSGIVGVMWGRLAACAAVVYRRCPLAKRDRWPIDNRPQLGKLPHNQHPAPRSRFAADTH
jgi:hypothetical protein